MMKILPSGVLLGGLGLLVCMAWAAHAAPARGVGDNPFADTAGWEAPATYRTDRLDRLKYVRLHPDGRLWASVGGNMRGRLENWHQFDFGTPAEDDDTFFIWRLLAHVDLHLGDHVRLFVQGKSATATDRDLPGGIRTLDADYLALQQGFVELLMPIGAPLTLALRLGRQALSFGKQRLVSPLLWVNTMRTWDGVQLIASGTRWQVHGFWTLFTPIDKDGFNTPDRDHAFSGVHATAKWPLGDTPGQAVGIDLYLFGRERQASVVRAGFNGTAGDESRFTVGARVFGELVSIALDYDLEGAYQFGTIGDHDIQAYMLALQVGLRPLQWWGQPRVFVGFDYASGDHTPGGDVQTFDPLFPLGHAFFGFADVIGRQNIISVSGGITLSPIRQLSVGVSGHRFWRADRDDALYNAGGGVLRTGDSGTAHDLGGEVDLTLTYHFTRRMVGLFGYSHVFAGEFIDESGAHAAIDFVYLQTTYTF